MSDGIEVMAKNAGFEDALEMSRMVASVNLTKPGMMARFLAWRNDDGSKAGLAKLLEP